MIRRYGKVCAFWLCRFLYIQSFLSLISLPILIGWGLPFSYASALGNLIFAPIIMIFLLVASVIFFCHLLYIPCGWALWVLEEISTFWSWLLTFSDSTWLATFSCPAFPLLFLIPCMACMLVIQLAPYTLWRKTTVMTASALLLCSLLRISSQIFSPSMAILPSARGDITFVYKNQQLIMIDSGGMGALKGIPSWTHYICAPYIAKTFGKMKIDILIVLKATPTTLKAIRALHEVVNIAQLYIPGKVMRSNADLAQMLASLSINVVSLERDVIVLSNHQEKMWGTITLYNDVLHKHGMPQYVVTMEGIIDNKSVTIYPSGYTKRNKDAYK